MFFNSKRIVSLFLGASLLFGHGFAASSDFLTADVRVTVTPADLKETIPIPGASRKVNMVFHGVSIRDALRALAKQGGFNVLIDESVQGAISATLNDVTIQDALETLKNYGKLAYSVQGNNLMVADAESDKGKSFQRSMTRMIPLKHANAKMMAELLNQTIFADRIQSGNTSGTAQSRPVTADYHTNSLIAVGSPTDIKTVMEHVEALDQPRQMRTWRLSQANALDVATILSSSLFNEGRPALIVSGAAGGGTTTAAGATTGTGVGGQIPALPSTLRITAENIEEGTGASQASQSGGNSSSGSGSTGTQTAIINNMTLRDRKKESQSVQISPTGAILIPDTRLNTLTLMGTAEQIAIAETLIPTLDRKVPQVVLEASLIEISEGGLKELGYNAGFSGRIMSGGSNNSPTASRQTNKAASNLIGLPTSSSNPFETLLQITSNPATRSKDFVFQLNALVSKNKAKILANPTVVTASDNEAIISIVDEIIKSITITTGSVAATPTFTHNIGEAGIVLNLLPKVGPDGSISLRVRPIVSTVAGTKEDRFGNLITLLSKREILTQNTVLKDGETFVLGGLIHNTNTQTVYSNPLLSKLPIVGALARNSSNNKERTELVILITPHIINDDAQISRTPGNPKSAFQATSIGHPVSQGFVPVSIPTNALPPMEEVRVLDAGSSGAPNTRTYQNKPMEPARASQHSVAYPGRTDDISDETIRRIINRFK